MADREIDAAAGALQLLGDLCTRGAGTDDQHGAGRQLVRCAVGAGMDLEEIEGVRQQRRQHRALIGPGGDDDVGRCDGAGGRLGDEAGFVLRRTGHLDAAADRGGDELGVGGEEVDDVALVQKPSGSVCGKGKSGSFTDQLGNWKRRPSQRSVRQRSAMRARSTNEMPAAALAQPAAQSEPGLAAADEERLYVLIGHA